MTDIKPYIPETIPEFKLEEGDIPGLTSDKLDANISIRGSITPKFYSGKIFNSGTSNIKVTTGFKPKYVYIFAIYNSGTEDSSSSSFIIDNDGVLEVMTTYSNGNTQYTLGKGDTSIRVVELTDSPAINAKMNSFVTDGFILDNVSFFGGCNLQILAIG